MKVRVTFITPNLNLLKIIQIDKFQDIRIIQCSLIFQKTKYIKFGGY